MMSLQSKLFRFATCIFLALACSKGSASPSNALSGNTNTDPRNNTEQRTLPTLDLKFHEVKLGGFERRKITSELRVRGWKIGNALVGQTKVAGHWGLGFVLQQGATTYGVNHRGIQVMRRF